MGQIKTWTEADLRLEEIERGLLVSQADRTYLARKWRLTSKVCDLVDLALKHELKYVIRWDQKTGQTIPREVYLNTHTGVEYIDFSRNKYGRWIVGIDQYSGRPDIKQVVLEKSFHRYIAASGVRWVWETHGGQNIFLPFEDLPLVLSRLTEEVIRDVEQGLGQKDRTRARIERTAIITEDDLCRVFVDAIRDRSLDGVFGHIRQHVEKPQFTATTRNPFVSVTQKALIPDLVLFSRDTCFIVELKKGSAGLAEVQQVLGYLASEDAATWAGGRRLRGVLVAARFSEDGLREAGRKRKAGHALSLYGFHFDGHLALTPALDG